MIRQTRGEVIVLADSSKVGVVGDVVICTLDKVDAVIVDDGVNDDVREEIGRLGHAASSSRGDRGRGRGDPRQDGRTQSTTRGGSDMDADKANEQRPTERRRSRHRGGTRRRGRRSRARSRRSWTTTTIWAAWYAPSASLGWMSTRASPSGRALRTATTSTSCASTTRRRRSAKCASSTRSSPSPEPRFRPRFDRLPQPVRRYLRDSRGSRRRLAGDRLLRRLPPPRRRGQVHVGQEPPDGQGVRQRRQGPRTVPPQRRRFRPRRPRSRAAADHGVRTHAGRHVHQVRGAGHRHRVRRPLPRQAPGDPGRHRQGVAVEAQLDDLPSRRCTATTIPAT